MKKEELEELISRAVASALEKSNFKDTEQDIDSGIMQINELCEYLKIKPSAVYQLTFYKRIPFFKRGKRIFFKREEIDEWLRNGRKVAVLHVEEEARLTKVGFGRK